MNLGEVLDTFIHEAQGLLQDMEGALLRLEEVPGDAEAINAVFRAAHTIKGSAGLFGLDAIVAFTHAVENVLDRARSHQLAVDGGLVSLILDCRDHIEQLVLLAAAGEAPDDSVQGRGGALAAALARYQGERPAAAPAVAAALVESGAASEVAGDTWHISVRFGPEVLRNGMDPASFIRYLGTLAEITHLVTLPDAIPAAAEMDPELCYLGFELRLRGELSRACIEDAFEFVRDDCELRILPPGSKLQDYLQLIAELPEPDVRLGEILVRCGAVTERELAAALAEQAATAPASPPLGEVLVAKEVVEPRLVDAALARQQESRRKQAQEASSIRVHADKLDHLINLVGELVIASSGVALLAQKRKDSALLEAVSGAARLVEEIREGAMRLRMVEIGETFNRFRRVVRDVSRELGKSIELTINGADTELDKSLVERIGDPLTHLVRNAMDHGIEHAEVRLARGKPATGRVHLSARHESGNVVIEVADDGGGLDRERILAKAVERGLVEDGARLSDAQVWQLVFEPGFSTAEQVSNLSGRGVGMDVVRRGIEALRGTVEIDNHPGAGCTFRIRLPLTLAIIDGFLLRVGAGYYVVPLDMVQECVGLDEARLVGGRGCLDLRGEVLPLLYLGRHFGLEETDLRPANVVVVQCAGAKAGLVVDALEGELQAVVKPLGRLFARLRGISGSTILGSGEVALMLDLPALLNDRARAEVRNPALAA